MKPKSVYRPANRKPRLKRPEQGLQIAIFNQLRPLMALQKRKKFMAFHVPNGGYRTGAEANIFQSMGVMPGVADIVLLFPYSDLRSCVCSRVVFIELKAYKPLKTKEKPDDSTMQNENQKDFHESVKALGFDYRVLAAKDPADACNQMFDILREFGAA